MTPITFGFGGISKLKSSKHNRQFVSRSNLLRMGTRKPEMVLLAFFQP